MRARVLVPVTLLALTTALAWPHVATASSGPATLHITEKVVKFTQLDLGKHGPSQGDTFTYTLQLMDAKGRHVGTGGGTATSVAPKAGTLGLVELTGTYNVGGDQITIAGFYDFNETSGTIPIVGGTGRYRGVTGQVDFVAKGTDSFVNTFRFNR